MIRFPGWLVSGCLLVGLLLPAPAANASLVLALDLPAMVKRSENVAVVDVVSVSSAWDDRHERILTTVDLAVVESWKGSAAPATHIKLVQRGGTVGDITMMVYGMSRFTPGERAVVFLEGKPERSHVVGMAQGKRQVLREANNGRWMVQVPDRAGASFVRMPNAGPSPVFDIAAKPIEDLRNEVRTLSTATGQGR
jgi:hypothetical protein